MPPRMRRSWSGVSEESTASAETLFDEEQQRNAWQDDSPVWTGQHHNIRTLVLCFDGTGDQFDADNSNVVQFVSMLQKHDPTRQLVYYQPGIGTYADPVVRTRLFTSVYQTLDEMLAINLANHIKDGYAFLMQNYTSGDKICIFGFSRGAHIARALAGMLKKVGLLPPHNHQQIQFAYNMYTRVDADGCELSTIFKRTFCHDVDVAFVGVWDTVASIGFIPHYLPFISENNAIRYLRHALALDERRIKFLPHYCVDPQKMKAQPKVTLKQGRSEKKTPLKEYEDKQNEGGSKTSVLEVWFAGVHADVGGGSVKNNTRHALSRIPLRWMIRECFRCETGIIFDAKMLQDIAGLDIVYGPGGVVEVDRNAPAPLPGMPNDLQFADKPKQSLFSVLFQLMWAVTTMAVVRLAFFLGIRRFSGLATMTLLARLILHGTGAPLKNQTYVSIPHGDDTSHTLREAEEEKRDALSPLFDRLKANWFWLILEYAPVRIKKQKAIIREMESADWFTWIWNRGRGRKIYKFEMREGMKVHRSVKTRLEAGTVFEGECYVPQVRPNIPADGHAKRKSKDPKRLGYHEWNVKAPKHWEWVD